MSRLKYMALPVAIVLIAAIYWWFSYEPAGTVMLVVFAIAMALFGWALLPTLNDVGPTAPVDPDWDEQRRPS